MGEFIVNFPKETSMCVEPCDNFSNKVTKDTEQGQNFGLLNYQIR